MAFCSSCFGRSRTAADEPLLPDYHRHDETLRQQKLHRKLHSYQMLRAVSKGAMPSTEQLVAQLRSIVASDLLNPADATLSDSGRLLAKHSRALLRQLIELLLHKNRGDALQDLIWCLYSARLADHLPRPPSWQAVANARSQTCATAQSISTLSSLLLTNSDFRLFLSDLQTVGRQIFRDVAFSTSTAAEHVGEHVDPSGDQTDATALQQADANGAPSEDGLSKDTVDVTTEVARATKDVAADARESTLKHLSGPEKTTLVQRLQAAVLKLRQRPDYSESVSTLTIILRHFALNYVTATENTVAAAEGNIKSDPYVTSAIESLSSLLTSFGDSQEWHGLRTRWNKCLSHIKQDEKFPEFVDKAVFALQKIFMDPAVLANADTDLSNLRQALLENRKDRGSLEADTDAFLEQLRRVWSSVINDDQVLKVVASSFQVIGLLSSGGGAVNGELTGDFINVLGPLLIQAIQYVPIPRLEVSTPDIDLLLENLILEPGRTVNASSFLPFRFRVETYNDVEIRKARFGTTSRATSLATIKIDGLSIRAEDIGFILKTHSGIFNFADEGIASFELDERGIDVHLDVEIGKEQLEHVLSLRAVRVRVHKLKYNLRKSKFSCLAWVLKPLLGFIVRKTIEKQLAAAVADFFHAANREIIFMRERLRATRISQPQDIATFFKAVLARLTPPDDPDTSIRVGVGQPGAGVFHGVYAPGSIVKTWVEEGMRAGEVVDDYQRDGWRNDIFDALPS